MVELGNNRHILGVGCGGIMEVCYVAVQPIIRVPEWGVMKGDKGTTRAGNTTHSSVRLL